MQVCTTTILFKEHPLVWEYDEKTDTATFLFSLAGARESYDKSTLLAYIMELGLEGLEIGEELSKEGQIVPEVVISQAKKFFKIYPMMPILEYQVKLKVPNLNLAQIRPGQDEPATLASRNRSQTLLSPKEAPSLDLLALPRHSSAPEKKSRVLGPIGLWLDHLIPVSDGVSSIWGRTLCYEEYFGEKLEKDLLSRGQFIETNSTVFIKECNYPKNKELYLIKSDQIKLIRELFDEILAPLHEKMQPPDEIDAEIIKYFQTVIEGVMVNDPVNLGPTDLEKLSETKQLIRYKGNRQELNSAIEKERIDRANTKMLKPLLFFVQDDIESSNLSGCQQVQQLLDKLKLAIKEKNLTARVESLLVKLGKLTAQSGQIEDKHIDNEKLITAQIQEKTALIGKSSYSFYRMISNLLEKQLRGKTKKKESLIEEISTKLFEAIVNTMNTTMKAEITEKVIPKIFPESGDFYICKEWHDRLLADLKKVFSSIDLSSKKTVEENQEKLVSEAHDFIIGFIKLSIERAKQPKELVVTPRPSSDKRDFISISRGASKSLPSLSPKEKPPLAPRLTVSGDRIHRPVSPRVSIKDREQAQINRESFFSGKTAPQRKEAARPFTRTITPKHLLNQTKDDIIKPGRGPGSSN